jgi:hypothetical protein
MYSRYAGYRPFDPMSNRLSANYGPHEEAVPEQLEPPERHEAPAADIFSGGAPLAALPAAAAPNFLQSLLGGGGRSDARRGNQGGGLLGSLGGAGNTDIFAGIADILRSGGGGITKLLSSFSIDWDAGDILMVLILLFMSLESDDDEILILLALVLVLGL